MPLSTDLSQNPYYETSNDAYYQVLFKPGVTVQTRELNEIQLMLQKQFERFGDNIFTKGTIVSGCQFNYYSDLAYVKLNDSDIDGNSVQVVSLVNQIATSESTGLRAYIIDTVDGFQASDPDLKTLYMRYTNSGTAGNTATFANNDILRITNTNNSIFSVSVSSASVGFSNSDIVVFVSPLAIQNSTGGLNAANGQSLFTCLYNEIGNTITQATTGAVATVLSVNATANSSSLIITLKPLANNLANSYNSAAWEFSPGYTIVGGNTGVTANVVSLVGSGAAASLVTDGAGAIGNVNMTSLGQQYIVPPTVVIAAANNTGNTSSISSVSLVAKNYITRARVATVTNSTGNSYAVAVTSGYVYQKGFIAKVDPQIVIVDKYDTNPNNVVAGFLTVESIANSNIDSALLDNANTAKNYGAPGADRLILTPTLTILDANSASSNSDFLALVTWNYGQPVINNPTTSYSAINDAMAQRTFEEAGNFVVDPFVLTTESQNAMSDDASTFEVVIDPGIGYIDGYRVESDINYTLVVNKGIDTQISAGQSLDIDYGNYIRVQELGGTFLFNLGDTVSLQDTPFTYITNHAGAPITAGAGNQIGQARMKSLVLEQGAVGSPGAIYRLYLFDISMNAGQNFKNVLGVFYNGTGGKALADTVTQIDGTTGANIAVLQNTTTDRLCFPTGLPATKTLKPNVSSANLVYTVRTISNTAVINASSNISITLSGGSYFPYASGALNDTQKADILIIPTANVIVSVNSVGQVVTTSGQSNIVGTSTVFAQDYQIGDYIQIANSSVAEYKRISGIVNNTLMMVSNNFTNSFTAANTTLFFPGEVPIPIVDRANRTVTIVANTTMYIGLGNTVTLATNAAVAFNKNIAVSSNAIVKTAQRHNYTMINTATHPEGVTGPWCLGIPDIFRLRNVYVGNSSANASSTTITNEFYIDHNQNTNYYGLGYLYQKPTSTYEIPANSYLLVDYDIFVQSNPGAVTIDSYPINDTISLATADTNRSASTINTLEIPEFFDNNGNDYDLRDQVDMRLRSANTAAIANTPGAATVNPSEPSFSARFNLTTDKLFPAPGSDVYFDSQNYLGRIDRVIMAANGSFLDVSGVPGSNVIPAAPNSTLTINTLNIPPYPSVPAVMSANVILIADTSIANERYANERMSTYAILPLLTNTAIAIAQPQVYTQEDIGNLDRRLTSVEYNLTMTMNEVSMINQVIPSSSNSALSRYKFGFFVDDFNTLNYSDINNPQYSATIIDNELWPGVIENNLPFSPYANSSNVSSGSQIVTLPYVEYNLVSQTTVTDGPVQITETGDYSNGTITGLIYVKNALGANTVETYNTTLSSQTATATLYFRSFELADRWEVYQNTVSNFDYTVQSPLITSESFVDLSAADRVELGWLVNGGDTVDASFVSNGTDVKYYVDGVGKMIWTHDPNSGRYYTIVVKKSPNDVDFEYYASLPFDAIVTANTTPVVTPKTNYAGAMTTISPSALVLTKSVSTATVVTIDQEWYRNSGKSFDGSYQSWLSSVGAYQTFFNGISMWVRSSNTSTQTVTYTAANQKINIVVSSLKPNTQHFFFWNGVDETIKTRDLTNSANGTLTSNSSGGLNIEFYYDTTLANTSYTTYIENQILAGQTAGTNSIKVASADGSSIALGVISYNQDITSIINSTTSNTVLSKTAIVNNVEI